MEQGFSPAVIMKRTAFIVVSVIVAAALAIGAVLYLLDVQGDRDTIITITGPVRVFDSESPPGYIRGDNGVIEFLHAGDPARVLRIHDHNGVESIRVRLRDGREGYIFCCDNFVIER